MDFAYYVVRQRDMVILDGATDVVGSINIAQKQGCACLIVQGCVVAEIGQDEVPVDNSLNEKQENVEILSTEE